jgi:peptidoglycan/LPS O-acetylase OafA/YrhL
VSVPLALLIESHHARWIGFSVIAAASVSFVYLALFSTNRGLRALLTNRFLVYTGTISYGIYLLEKIPLDIVKAAHLDKHPLLAFLLATTATYALASLSWKLLEQPFLRFKRFFEGKKSYQHPIADELVGAA